MQVDRIYSWFANKHYGFLSGCLTTSLSSLDTLWLDRARPGSKSSGADLHFLPTAPTINSRLLFLDTQIFTDSRLIYHLQWLTLSVSLFQTQRLSRMLPITPASSLSDSHLHCGHHRPPSTTTPDYRLDITTIFTITHHYNYGEQSLTDAGREWTALTTHTIA
jgi:hypothetical protein